MNFKACVQSGGSSNAGFDLISGENAVAIVSRGFFRGAHAVRRADALE